MKITPPSALYAEARRLGECSDAMKPALDAVIASAVAAGWDPHDAALAISHLAIEMVLKDKDLEDRFRNDAGAARPSTANN